MSVTRVSIHAALGQLLRQLPLAGLVLLFAISLAGCQSDKTDAVATAPASPTAQTANAGAAQGAPPPVSSAVQAQIDASRKAQQAAMLAHYRATAPQPAKPQ